MRITGGKYKGRMLQAPKGKNTIRPTSDKVRLAMFNMLESRGLVENSVVLDVFCGTGALGLEALSRGASFCIFMDKSRDSLSLCKDNIGLLEGSSDKSFLVRGDARKPPSLPDNTPKADLVFLDPPYGKNLVTPALKHLSSNGWMQNEYIAVTEMSKTETLGEAHVQVISEKVYGDTRLYIMAINH
jgi:16S rRNA (guanine966-N2)-methyltransferase